MTPHTTQLRDGPPVLMDGEGSAKNIYVIGCGLEGDGVECTLPYDLFPHPRAPVQPSTEGGGSACVVMMVEVPFNPAISTDCRRLLRKGLLFDAHSQPTQPHTPPVCPLMRGSAQMGRGACRSEFFRILKNPPRAFGNTQGGNGRCGSGKGPN